MPKHIVICMDGTWNDPTEQTNVFKIFQMLPGDAQSIREKGPVRSHSIKQSDALVGLYLEGVGSHGRTKGLLGGSMGIGLHDRVIDAFVLASQYYARGDRFWIFGFSRGAWSARSLGGFIAGAGLLDQAASDDATDRAEALWIRYKHKQAEAAGQAYWAGLDRAPIQGVAVWDTVGALGVPFFNGVRAVDRIERQLFDFADTRLSDRVEIGLHALAVDETRFDFTPTLWDSREGVVQEWFAGVHADVGGGYAATGLSDITLGWMTERVNAVPDGIRLDTARLMDDFVPDPLANRHDEACKPVWKLRPREARKIAPAAAVHASVFTRLQGRADYRPGALRPVTACAPYYTATTPPPAEQLNLQAESLPLRRLDVGATHVFNVFAQNWWNAAGLQVSAGEHYRITAAGQWKDLDNSCDADGYASNSTLLKLFEGTRRVESALWFALIAVVHGAPDLEARNSHGGGVIVGAFESWRDQVAKIDAASQCVRIGKAGDVTVGADGYLYAFANDSAFAYDNNAGFLEVTIQRVA